MASVDEEAAKCADTLWWLSERIFDSSRYQGICGVIALPGAFILASATESPNCNYNYYHENTLIIIYIYLL